MDINRACSFKNCTNSTLNGSHCCFYEFPVDFNLCLQWLEVAGKKDFYEDLAYGGAVPFRKKYICSDHFANSDFIEIGNIFAGIKSNAVPKFIWPEKTVTVEDHLEFVPIKKEPPDKEFWGPYDLSQPVIMPIEVLEKVKVEEVSSQSIGLTGHDTGFDFLGGNGKEEIMSRRRANESPEQRVERLRRNADRAAYHRSMESEEQTLVRRRRNAMRTSIRRSLESTEERERRRKMNAERQAKKRQNESPEQKEIRRMKDLLRARRRRLLETEDQAKLRRINDAARAQSRRTNESEEEKKLRKLNDLIRITNRRRNESSEERKERLRKNLFAIRYVVQRETAKKPFFTLDYCD